MDSQETGCTLEVPDFWMAVVYSLPESMFEKVSLNYVCLLFTLIELQMVNLMDYFCH